MKRRYRTVSKSEAIVALVLFLLLGTVFVFLEGYVHRSVDRQELRYVDAVYQRYHQRSRNLSVRDRSSMDVYFENYEVCDIAYECVNDELRQRLDMITPGTVLRLGLHPNSNTILEITDHGRTVMEFAESQSRLTHHVRGFLLLGVFMYACAGYFLYLLARGKAR